jgi:hypothetical protein
MRSSSPLQPLPPRVESDFCRRLSFVGRILEDPDYIVWCCAPIYGPDGKVHVFYSRWPREAGFQAWLTHCEVAHAVADDPAGPYKTVDVALAGRGPGHWDACTIHNPTIHRVGDRYALFYMANAFTPTSPRDEAINTKRVGVAFSDSLYGPWERPDQPLITTGPAGSWDEVLVSNPAFLAHPQGQCWLYYKGVDTDSWRKFHGNRKYGLAVAETLTGPYRKHVGNPLIDMSVFGEHYECEDAYMWHDGEGFHAIMRDMGVFGEQYGLYLHSDDGIRWGTPQIGYHPSPYYLEEPPNDLPRKERFERPQLLFKDGQPSHLFVAFRGGRYQTASAAVLKINDAASTGRG